MIYSNRIFRILILGSTIKDKEKKCQARKECVGCSQKYPSGKNNVFEQKNNNNVEKKVFAKIMKSF